MGLESKRKHVGAESAQVSAHDCTTTVSKTINVMKTVSKLSSLVHGPGIRVIYLFIRIFEVEASTDNTLLQAVTTPHYPGNFQERAYSR